MESWQKMSWQMCKKQQKKLLMQINRGHNIAPLKGRLNMRKDNKRTIALYMFPAILMIVVLLYLPIFINLYESFFSWGAMSSSHKFVGIGNYIKMFKDEVFYTALKNNMIFMIMSVIFQIGLSLIIANTLESKFMRKTQNIFQSIYFIPSLLMVTVVGIAFKMICSPSIGIMNPLLELIGINTENIDLLGNAGSATFSIAAMSQWQYIGYTVVLLWLQFRIYRLIYMKQQI